MPATGAMHLDVVDLRSFYYRTVLGRAAQKSVRQAVLRLWEPAAMTGQTVVGFGFAAPVLRPFLEQARRVIALMPGRQGVVPWPAGRANIAVLAEESLWPVETGSVDRLVVLHGLETSENPPQLLDECWRALGPGGRALFIVPNRAGLWSRRDATPFGFGRPYSLSQLESQLRRHSFTPERHLAALFQPPSQRRFWLRTGAAWESVGQRLPTTLAGGAILVEATKQVHAATRHGLPEAVKKRLRALDGLTAPSPKPV